MSNKVLFVAVLICAYLGYKSNNIYKKLIAILIVLLYLAISFLRG